MSYRRTKIGNSIDWITVALYLLLVIAGWFSIYAASYNYDQISILDLSGRAGMQMIWILSSLLIGGSLLLVERNWYEFFALWIYILVLAILILTIFVAPDIKGSRSWLVLGPIRIQPAEFAKFATALAVAKIMSIYNFEIMKPGNLSAVLIVILFPMMLILLQNETGSALVFLAFILVMYREGMPGAVLFSGSTVLLLFVLAVRYSEMIWQATPAGECLGLICIFLFMIVLLAHQPEGRRKIKHILYLTAALCVPAAVVSFFIAFDWCWILLFLIAYDVVLLFLSFLRSGYSSLLWIIFFALTSTGFLYSVDYVFDNVLELHQ
jgi:rod shape determining protein RodA